jgi:hypothetical protein
MFLVAVSFKEGIELIRYFKNLITKADKKELEKENQIAEILNEIKEIKKDSELMKQSCKYYSQKIDMLVGSDVEDIRAYIIAKYHKHVEKEGWVDDYTMDVLERRYKYYKDEGGNSYIKDLMSEIRKLPKRPPYEKEKE